MIRLPNINSTGVNSSMNRSATGLRTPSSATNSAISNSNSNPLRDFPGIHTSSTRHISHHLHNSISPYKSSSKNKHASSYSPQHGFSSGIYDGGYHEGYWKTKYNKK